MSFYPLSDIIQCTILDKCSMNIAFAIRYINLPHIILHKISRIPYKRLDIVSKSSYKKMN